ncbi:MAG: DNA cytosine methyltransferase [Candidatus Thorarchaeota archaeon]
MAIPVIDIFAGPGGLGEGFSNVINNTNNRSFKICLSVEKDVYAHETLTLRSFFRQFDLDNVPNDYYKFLKGELSLVEIYENFPIQANAARQEALLAELGNSASAISNQKLDNLIQNALNNETNWVLIGGPPCQAYSVVGRSRRQEKILDGSKDERVELYKQYLRILAIHNPTVFVMENVKGLLSAETKESPVFSKILNDLSDPVSAYYSDYGRNGIELQCPGYRIFSVVERNKGIDENDNPIFNHKDFIIKAEEYGIPQTRHRVILLGIRKDHDIIPPILAKREKVKISTVISGLPKLRSGLSKIKNTDENWLSVLSEILNSDFSEHIPQVIRKEIESVLSQLSVSRHGTGADYIPYKWANSQYCREWFIDDRIQGVCNHSSRGHMESDLHRYLFISCFAKKMKRSTKLVDFPEELLPNHKNVKEGIENKKFADRFRVQLWNKPSKTITSHISKDGHYYIHPDPKQCRSFTVREAARIQTFPDNYFFCGPRTQQYHQVGNAVPPFLAYQIAESVSRIFRRINNEDQTQILNQEFIEICNNE